MEKLVKIVQDFGLQQRPYTASNGENKIFKSRTLYLTDGIDSFVADLTGEQAESYTPLDPALMHRVQCELRARQWTDKDGQLRYSNEITIRRIV